MNRVEPWWRMAERYAMVSVQTHLRSASPGDRFRASAYPLPDAAISAVVEHCEPYADVQPIIDHGRAEPAVRRALSMLMPDLLDGSAQRGLSVGRPIVVRACRPGVVETVARALDPRVVILITGKRRAYGCTAEMSAVVAVRPDWDARPACYVRLWKDESRRDGPSQTSSGAGYSQAVRLLLDVAYALAASQGGSSGVRLDAEQYGRGDDRTQWNPDGLPEKGR